MRERKAEEKKPPGPDPEHLKIDLPWEEAVQKALRKKKPAEGETTDAPKREPGNEG